MKEIHDKTVSIDRLGRRNTGPPPSAKRCRNFAWCFFHSTDSVHGPAGEPVETINAIDPATLDGVSAWISDNSTVALVGSSGVGKSTLLNALAEKPLAATGEIREHDRKGRHITTHRDFGKMVK